MHLWLKFQITWVIQPDKMGKIKKRDMGESEEEGGKE